MCAGRSASDEIDLASQPTMTRLENRLTHKELFDIGESFIDDFIASYNSEPDSIIIDADDTNADIYGAQQLTLFNAYYGEYCYMPLCCSRGAAASSSFPSSDLVGATEQSTFQADMLVGTELECSTITTMREKLLLSAVSCAFWTSSGAAFGHIERLLSEKPCGAREMRTNRTATAKTKRGGYE